MHDHCFGGDGVPDKLVYGHGIFAGDIAFGASNADVDDQNLAAYADRKTTLVRR